MLSPRAQALLSVALSGCLCAVGASLGPAGPAATCVALVPWIVALDRARTWKATLGLAALMAAVFVVAVFPWFPGAVARYSGGSPGLIWALFVLGSPVLAPQLFAFALVRRAVLRETRGSERTRSGVRSEEASWQRARAAVAACGAFVAADVFWPKLFFDTLGIGLSPSSLLRQGADLAGVHGLTALVLAVNVLVAEAVRRAVPSLVVDPFEEDAISVHKGGDLPSGRRLRRAAAPLGAALALLGAAAVYGAVRTSSIRDLDPERTILVGAVQANLTAYDKLRAEQGAAGAMAAILDRHVGMSRELLDDGPVHALVWPETVYPTTFGTPKGEGAAVFEAALRDFVAASRVPLVFGAYEADGEREHNAMFFVQPGDRGLAVESYRKRMLFPLTEWVPEAIDSPWLRRTLPWTGRWSRGPGPRTVQLGVSGQPAVSVLPLVCYDAVVPDHVAGGAALGADLIVTISNDAWFPSERAAELHLASAALRSVETRLPQLRVTVSGISALILPTGEIPARSGWETAAKMRVEVPLFARAAPPARWLAPWLGPIAGLAALALIAGAARRARGARQVDPPPAAEPAASEPRATRQKPAAQPAGAAPEPRAINRGAATPGSRERRRKKR